MITAQKQPNGYFYEVTFSMQIVNNIICKMDRHYFTFLKAFRKIMYSGKSARSFQKRWKAFVVEYQTNRNKGWLKMMYNSRKLWAATLQYGKYFLGMRSNQRSESLNSSLHRHLDIYMSLCDLVEHYENCVCRLQENEAHDDCVASQSVEVPLTDYKDIEIAAAHIFTCTNFYKVQEEISKIDEFQLSENLVGDGIQKICFNMQGKHENHVYCGL